MAFLQQIPDHVPPELVVDFDIFNIPDGKRDLQAAWVRLGEGPAIVWTPHNGGHWIATDPEDLHDMQINDKLFSYASVTIPRSSTPSLPLESDPPQHTRLRKLISPLFTPNTLQQVEQQARELTASIIETLKPLGRCEFKKDFTLHLPIFIFLKLVNLPQDDSVYLVSLADTRTRSPIPEERDNAKAKMVEYMQSAIAERRKNPGSDFISRVLHGEVDGEKLSESDANNMLATLLSGGLDTVASMMCFAMWALARHPELTARLVKEPDVIPRAVDEILRRHGIVNTSRVIVKDVNYKGVPLRKGEKIVVPNCLIGLDPAKFPHPMEIDFDRPNSGNHGSFGAGAHRCPGANLARLEIKIMLEEWLKRIPEFCLDTEKPFSMASGNVGTVQELHLQWQ